MNEGQSVNVKLDVSDRVLGGDIEFQDGSMSRLSEDQVNEPLFREARTGRVFNLNQMISNLLMKTNTRKQDLIKPAAMTEAFEKGICVGKPDLNMSFTPGSVEFTGGVAAKDIKRIVFDVELTVRPKKSS